MKDLYKIVLCVSRVENEYSLNLHLGFFCFFSINNNANAENYNYYLTKIEKNNTYYTSHLIQRLHNLSSISEDELCYFVERDRVNVFIPTTFLKNDLKLLNNIFSPSLLGPDIGRRKIELNINSIHNNRQQCLEFLTNHKTSNIKKQFKLSLFTNDIQLIEKTDQLNDKIDFLSYLQYLAIKEDSSASSQSLPIVSSPSMNSISSSVSAPSTDDSIFSDPVIIAIIVVLCVAACIFIMVILCGISLLIYFRKQNKKYQMETQSEVYQQKINTKDRESELQLQNTGEIEMKEISKKDPKTKRKDSDTIYVKPVSEKPLAERQWLTVDVSKYEMKFSDLEIEKRLGKGSFGTVHKATHFEYNVPVAVKTFDVANTNEEIEKVMKEFSNEVSVLAQLRHPNVILFLGAVVELPNLAIVTEFINGGSLYHALHGGRDLSWSEKIRIIIDVIQGINYLHGQGMFHHDLKSQNILLMEEGGAKVADFGLTNLKEVGMSSYAGTPFWMAPETMHGEPYTMASDIYSFGIVMWEMLTHQKPYDHVKDKFRIPVLVANDPSFRPFIPQEIESDPKLSDFIELMKQCWSHNPKERPSGRAIADTLQNLLDSFES